MKNLKDYPVIGTVTTTPLHFGDLIFPSKTYEVINILEEKTGKIYITNLWHKEYKQIPLMIHEALVQEYIPKG